MEEESKKPVWFEEKRSLCPKAKKEGNRGYRKKDVHQRNEPHIPHPHKKNPRATTML